MEWLLRALPSGLANDRPAKLARPYFSLWPNETPWGGEYDYNYWGATTRYGCIVPPGIYLGVQRDRSDSGESEVPEGDEQHFLDKGLNAGCLNGEIQFLLKRL